MIELAQGRLILIGTSHIAKESTELVRQSIVTHIPAVVAVELDANRLEGLLHPVRKNHSTLSLIRELGVTGYLFYAFASWAQQQLGKVVKLTPGADMLAAVRCAKEHNIPLALIDQDIRVTLANLSKQFTWRERFRFMRDIVMGLLFPRREAKRLGLEGFDLSKVPEQQLIAKMIDQLRLSYPTLHKVLVADRNKVMAKRLYLLLQNPAHTKIVAVIGAGHETEIAAMVEKALAHASIGNTR